MPLAVALQPALQPAFLHTEQVGGGTGADGGGGRMGEGAEALESFPKQIPNFPTQAHALPQEFTSQIVWN